MAIYFIKSKTKYQSQDGTVYLDKNISTHDEYNSLIAKWKDQVAKEAGCNIVDVEILSVSLLS